MEGAKRPQRPRHLGEFGFQCPKVLMASCGIMSLLQLNRLVGVVGLDALEIDSIGVSLPLYPLHIRREAGGDRTGRLVRTPLDEGGEGGHDATSSPPPTVNVVEAFNVVEVWFVWVWRAKPLISSYAFRAFDTLLGRTAP